MSAMQANPRVLVLGGNLGGLTVSRFIHERCEDAVDITVIDRKPYLIFVPNIPLEVMADNDPAKSMHLPIPGILDKDGTSFVQGEIKEIDLDRKRVTYAPTERSGGALERIGYDYLVIALGANLAYDRIEGFGEFGCTVSDSYYGNKLRKYLHHGGYRGGPIAIGSARFHQGRKGRPAWLPDSKSGCEGPPLEIALSLASWLKRTARGGPETITLFTPAEIIAEDAGKTIMDQFLQMAKKMGFGYKNNTQDIERVTADGIEFASGDSVDAELKIVLPDWVPLDVVKSLPIVDEVGFVVTDLTMRNPDHPEVLAVGDCAALTVPKLGAHGHQQAEIVARQIAKDVGKMDPDEADQKTFWPEIICMGEMGPEKAFYIHSDEWYGGDVSVFEMGYLYYALKLAFKEMYFRTGGKPPGWGVPLTEFVAEKL